MAFLSEAQSFGATLKPAAREAFNYLLNNAVGRSNAKTWTAIETHLTAKGLTMSKNTFQLSVIAPSRAAKLFIGSSDTEISGYFIIEAPADAAVTRSWYKKRILKEKENFDKLNDLMAEQWNIPHQTLW